MLSFDRGGLIEILRINREIQLIISQKELLRKILNIVAPGRTYLFINQRGQSSLPTTRSRFSKKISIFEKKKHFFNSNPVPFKIVKNLNSAMMINTGAPPCACEVNLLTGSKKVRCLARNVTFFIVLLTGSQNLKWAPPNVAVLLTSYSLQNFGVLKCSRKALNSATFGPFKTLWIVRSKKKGYIW